MFDSFFMIRVEHVQYNVVGLLPSCQNKHACLTMTTIMNLYLCEDYILLVPDVCELLGDYVFSLMHLYKCMNVMFIVPIKHKGRSRPALTRVTAPLSKGWVGVRGFSRPA